jgi:sugar phosphate isomerase/epimerase
MPVSSSRRQFLQLSAALILSGAAGRSAQAAVQSRPAAQAVCGLQLYTLRDLMEKSVADTLALVAGVGYREVEFAGYFGHSAKQIKQWLDQHGLQAPSVHVPLEQLRNNLAKVIDDAKVLDHRYIVLPWLSQEQRGSDISSYQALAAELNRYGETLAAAGLTMAYHNHDFELTPVKGGVPYDVLLQETDAALVKMELDLFWAVKAGVDPRRLFTDHPGRFPCLHIKDMTAQGEMTDVGAGVIDFAALLAAARNSGGSRHFFIEHDNSPNRIRTIRQGYQTLAGLL